MRGRSATGDIRRRPERTTPRAAARREDDMPRDAGNGPTKQPETPQGERGQGSVACASCDVARELAAEKARLVAWLAHELRTPLNCVLGYAEILCEGLAASGHSPHLADAERVRELAVHQLALLDDALDLARLENGSFPLRIEPVDAVRILGEVAAAALPLVQKGGNRLNLAVESEGRVLADGTRLRQILLNLVSNAARFTRDGLVALGATSRDGFVSLHVRDTGCGMTPAEAERAFRPFQQASAAVFAARGGTGLGLAISKELCERMAGSITLDTVPGEGTSITVTLPAVPAAPFRG
jgi:signal transduction histidine kinase